MESESITNLLKLHNVDLSAVKVNRILVDLGFLEEKERPSSKYAGKVKKFKLGFDDGQERKSKLTKLLWRKATEVSLRSSTGS